MRKVTSGTMVTGSSDDLIEITGELFEEFNAFNCSDGVMAISDGTLLKVNYKEDGIWRFAPLFKGSLYDRREEGSIADDTADEIYFMPGLLWCAFSDKMQVESKGTSSKC